MNNLQKRLITGVLGAVVLLFLITFHFLTLSFLCLVLTLFLSWEWVQLLNQKANFSQKLVGSFLGGITFLLTWLSISLENTFFLLFVPVNILFWAIWSVFWVKKQFASVLSAYLAIPVYIVIPAFCFFYVSGDISGFQWQYPLMLILGIWASDTFAYFVGKYFGKNKLFERVSPKKTWEGFLGGMIFAAITTAVAGVYFNAMGLIEGLLAGILIATIGTFGDLFESALKRSLDIKDSANTLAGHGGFLDRFDSWLFAAPAFYLYVQLISG